MEPPSTNGSKDRDSLGRFAKGNAGGPGNPHAAAVGRWRTMLAETVTAEDIRAVLSVLIEKAKAGQPWAVREFLDRTLGKADQRLEVTGEGDGPVASEITLSLQFADRSLIQTEQPLLESHNGEVGRG